MTTKNEDPGDAAVLNALNPDLAHEAAVKVLRDEAARKRVLTNAATILCIDPEVLLEKAGMKEALAKVVDESEKNHQELLEKIGAKSLEDSRIRDELLYAISLNLFTNSYGIPSLAAARKAFQERFLPNWTKEQVRKGIEGLGEQSG